MGTYSGMGTYCRGDCLRGSLLMPGTHEIWLSQVGLRESHSGCKDSVESQTFWRVDPRPVRPFTLVICGIATGRPYLDFQLCGRDLCSTTELVHSCENLTRGKIAVCSSLGEEIGALGEESLCRVGNLYFSLSLSSI